MSMLVGAEQMNVPRRASQLPDQIKNSESDQRAAGQIGKGVSDSAVDCHPAPHHYNSERSGENNVTCAGKAGDNKRFHFGPTLCSRRDDKRQPMRWNYRVKKSNRE